MYLPDNMEPDCYPGSKLIWPAPFIIKDGKVWIEIEEEK